MDSKSDKISDINTLFSEDVQRVLDVDICELDSEYIVEISLVGFDKDEIVIFIEDNTLYVEANRQDIIDEENKEFSMQKHNYSYCQRSFALEGINRNDIIAYYENNVIYIHLPKE